MKIKLLLQLLISIMYLNSFGQNIKELNDICYYSSINSKKTKKPIIGEINNINDYAIVERLMNSVNLYSNFTLVRCSNFNNASAFISNSGRRIIMYDEAFLKSLISKSTQYSKIGILAHEIGHHVLGHLFIKNIDMYESRQMELDADEFAGFLLKKYNSTEFQACQFIELLKENKNINSTHPNKETRLIAVKKGFNNERKIYLRNSNESKIIEITNSQNEGRFKDALDLIRADEKLEPYSNDLELLIKASVLMDNNLFEEAAYTYLKIAPRMDESLNPMYHYNYGLCLIELNKISEAKEQFERCIKISPEHIKAIGNLALIYRNNLNNPLYALKLLEQSILINNKNAHTYNIIGVTYSQYLKDINKGLYYFTLASDLEPDNITYKRNLAYSNSLLKQFKKCYNIYKDLCENYQDKESCNSMKEYEIYN